MGKIVVAIIIATIAIIAGTISGYVIISEDQNMFSNEYSDPPPGKNYVVNLSDGIGATSNP